MKISSRIRIDSYSASKISDSQAFRTFDRHNEVIGLSFIVTTFVASCQSTIGMLQPSNVEAAIERARARERHWFWQTLPAANSGRVIGSCNFLFLNCSMPNGRRLSLARTAAFNQLIFIYGNGHDLAIIIIIMKFVHKVHKQTDRHTNREK